MANKQRTIKMVRNEEKEQLWSTITHFFGIILGVIGFVFLLQKALQSTYHWSTIATVIFGISILFTYFSSTFFHYVKKEKIRKRLQIIDHISIYFLIAGTYTPFLLMPLNNDFGNLILVLIWIIAFLGTIFKLFFTGRFNKFSLFLYLFMGWFVVFDINDLIATLPPLAFYLLLLGGFFYSIGAVFYANNKIHYNHVIWHVFVLMGTTFHYFAVYYIL